jgi:hypothetical protein
LCWADTPAAIKNMKTGRRILFIVYLFLRAAS